MLHGIGAWVFDAYGTLFDFAVAARRCKDELGTYVHVVIKTILQSRHQGDTLLGTRRLNEQSCAYLFRTLRRERLRAVSDRLSRQLPDSASSVGNTQK